MRKLVVLTSNAKEQIYMLKTRIKTSLRKLTGQSDYQRWGNRQNLSPDWDSRSEKIAKQIEPGTSVIEFGAGRLVLKDLLANGCSYTPSDLVDRGYGTIVCDLNGTLPQLQPYDAAVFSGVLEYVSDVPRLISHLASCVNVIVASYAVTDTNKKNRRDHGWVNDYNSVQFIDIFERVGFQCDCTEEWRSQLIFRFTKR